MALSTCLVIFVNDDQKSGEFEPHITASVQVWDGPQHVATFDLMARSDFAASTLERDIPLEMWASHTGRQVARLLEEAFTDKLASRAYHYLSDFEVVSQVTPDQK